MAKPVGARCNLCCSYCYYLKDVGEPDAASQPRISDELLERFVCQYVQASPGPELNFVWHGGEPTLAGLDFYRRAVGLQQQYLPEGWTCWNNLQTNGLLLDDEWCGFLADAHFDVGLSIDGSQLVHDRNRLDRNGKGSYQQVVDAAKRLRTHGVHPDLLCTVSSASVNDPLGVYRALRNLDTGWIQFIPIVRRESDGSLAEESVSSEGYGEFLCTVFDEWACHDLGKLDIQLFAETARVWSGGSAGLCWMAPRCGRALVLEADGGIYSCDHYVNPEHRLGDIQSSELVELVDSAQQVGFGKNKHDSLPKQCRVCPWLKVCNGACPKDRFSLADDGRPGLNYLCGGLRRFFSHVQPLLQAISTEARRGRSLAAIMANCRTQMAARWQGVGRNDPCPCGSGKKAKSCCWSKRLG